MQFVSEIPFNARHNFETTWIKLKFNSSRYSFHFLSFILLWKKHCTGTCFTMCYLSVQNGLLWLILVIHISSRPFIHRISFSLHLNWMQIKWKPQNVCIVLMLMLSQKINNIRRCTRVIFRLRATEKWFHCTRKRIRNGWWERSNRSANHIIGYWYYYIIFIII